MKTYFRLLFTAMFMAALAATWSACKYDVTEPLWDKPYPEYPVPVITSIDPAGEAGPGVNYITIYGENFNNVPDQGGVIFGTTTVDIISTSATYVTVRRPNLVSDSSDVKVIPGQTLLPAKYFPYKIDKVHDTYLASANNEEIAALVVDNDENLYLLKPDKSITKITQSADTLSITSMNNVKATPSDAVLGPDGRLYIMIKNRDIQVLDPQTGEVSNWSKLPGGILSTYGDFDDNGYFYTAGSRTGLVEIAPDADHTTTKTGLYEEDVVTAVATYQNYLYLAVELSPADSSGNPHLAIWRHTLDANGNIGTRELFVDLTANEDYSTRSVTSLKFSKDGSLYIGTDADNPLLVVAPAANTADYFYKEILPSNCKAFTWGSGNYAYMIVNDADLNSANPWNVVRVNMGTTHK